jgi:hypothetical protein
LATPTGTPAPIAAVQTRSKSSLLVPSEFFLAFGRVVRNPLDRGPHTPVLSPGTSHTGLLPTRSRDPATRKPRRSCPPFACVAATSTGLSKKRARPGTLATGRGDAPKRRNDASNRPRTRSTPAPCEARAVPCGVPPRSIALGTHRKKRGEEFRTRPAPRGPGGEQVRDLGRSPKGSGQGRCRPPTLLAGGTATWAT